MRGERRDELLARQVKYLEAQLRMAVKLRLPICLHLRGRRDLDRTATDMGFECLERCKVPRNWRVHLHCYSGTWSEIEDRLAEYPNLVLGFTSLLRFKAKSHVREVVQLLPLDRMVLESDGPYFRMVS